MTVLHNETKTSDLGGRGADSPPTNDACSFQERDDAFLLNVEGAGSDSLLFFFVAEIQSNVCVRFNKPFQKKNKKAEPPNNTLEREASKIKGSSAHQPSTVERCFRSFLGGCVVAHKCKYKYVLSASPHQCQFHYGGNLYRERILKESTTKVQRAKAIMPMVLSSYVAAHPANYRLAVLSHRVRPARIGSRVL